MTSEELDKKYGMVSIPTEDPEALEWRSVLYPILNAIPDNWRFASSSVQEDGSIDIKVRPKAHYGL